MMQNSNQEIVSSKWSDIEQIEQDTNRDVYWLAHPRIQQRHNLKGTQYNGDNWVSYFVSKYLKLPVGRMLSIGCGMGDLERQLSALKAFTICEGVDVADGAIEVAKKTALSLNMKIDYYVADAAIFLEKTAETYDAIWFNGSLHHIENLETVLYLVSRKLNLNGYLFLNEYVGPTRFDLSARQKTIIEACFKLLPERYRRSCLAVNRGMLLPSAGIPHPKAVEQVDPSEAIRSGEIIATLTKYFHIQEKNNMGGSILQFLLCGIAGNFDDTLTSNHLLELLFQIEDTLINLGELESDFVTIAAKSKI